MMKGSWKTWSPFQSPEVRDICAHMTDPEKGQAAWHGWVAGLGVSVTLGPPFFLAVLGYTVMSIATALVMVPAYIAFTRMWQKRLRRFLCATAWARNQGITPERLRLFAFRATFQSN
ncbi:MAG: hypothetical protein KIS67_00130 [Verrucomicrobiae bacterium]|nr:hypothetical protein [Verrucomicrobiae bacterium]